MFPTLFYIRVLAFSSTIQLYRTRLQFPASAGVAAPGRNSDGDYEKMLRGALGMAAEVRNLREDGEIPQFYALLSLLVRVVLCGVVV